MSIDRSLAVASLLTFSSLVARAADQTLLGNQLAVKNPSTAVRRQIVVKAKEERSANTIVGNPVVAGATLTITANGGSSSEQTYPLPVGTSGFTGKPFWSADADGFKYRDARGENGAVKLVRIRKAGNRRFTLKAVLSGKLGTIGVLPPAPGTSGCALLQLTGGDAYSVAFPDGDGLVTNRTGHLYAHTKVSLEGSCITTTSSSTTTTTSTSSTTSTTCAANPDGGPDVLAITVGHAGTDLDIGWTGGFHNIPLVAGATFELCLSDCNGTNDTTCTAAGPQRPNATFGPPHPIVASSVPICIVNRWAGAVSGTADEATGAVSVSGAFLSDVYASSVSAVCPQCKSGTCDGGVNAGLPCTVEATHPVLVGPGSTELYELSSTCTPAGAPIKTLLLRSASLTTGGTVPLHGPTPCTAQPGDPTGVPPQENACGLAGCGAACTGAACVASIPDPTDPGQTVCVDARGGVSQACCNGDTTRPCFARDGNDDLIRSGRATVPQPPLPDASHPKTHVAVLASAFCIPATSRSLVDAVAGLPAPGTMLLHGTIKWTKR